MWQRKGSKGIPQIIALVFASGLIAALVMLFMSPADPNVPETPPAPAAPEENPNLSQSINRENRIAAPKKPPPPSIAAMSCP
mgnify:FL=1